MLNVTLVSIHIDKSPQAFPLAAGVLAAEAGSAANEACINLLDLYMPDELEASVESILEKEPDIVGFSVYLWNLERVISIAKEIKKKMPEIKLVAGGPEVTADPYAFDNFDLFTSLFTGEGEEQFTKFIKIRMEGGTPEKIFSQLKPLDPDTLSPPFLTQTINVEHYDGILWELSRGCIFNCSFCFEARGIHKVRSFSMNRIRKELRHFAAHNVKQIFVLDPTFNINPPRAKQILRMIREIAPDIHFTFEIRNEFLDMEMAELFASITCSIQIGIQSANPKTLKSVNRTLNREDFTEKTLLLHEAGVIYGFDLIYGLPGDTFESFCHSIDYTLSLRPNHLDIFPLAVLKGTDLYADSRKFGISYSKEKPYTIYSTPQFTPDDVKNAKQLAQSCDFFYNSGKAVPWFMMILDPLDITPSFFLQKFALFMAKKPRNYKNNRVKENYLEITKLQCDFISLIFNEYSMVKEGKAAQDIVKWFNTLSYLWEYTPKEGVILQFSFNIEKLVDSMEMGITDLKELAFFTEMTPCKAEVFLEEKEIFINMID